MEGVFYFQGEEVQNLKTKYSKRNTRSKKLIMPGFNFSFNDAERIELVEFILSKGTQFVHDTLYPSKTFEVISS